MIKLQIDSEKDGLLSWNDMSRAHFRVSVAKKYDILLSGSKKRGRSSKADIEKAEQIALTTAQTSAAASQLLARGPTEQDTEATNPDIAGIKKSLPVLTSGRSVATSADLDLPSIPEKPFNISERAEISPSDVIVALSNLAVPKSGGRFSKALGKSLQLYKAFTTEN